MSEENPKLRGPAAAVWADRNDFVGIAAGAGVVASAVRQQQKHADEVNSLLNALGEILRLSRDIEDVKIRNISNAAKLALVEDYNRKIATVCGEHLPG
jgi:hypothetical protein